MSVSETQAHLKARIWQAIAQSKLDLSAVPRETVDQLVDLAADAALLELDERLGDSLTKSVAEEMPAAEGDAGDEEILWEGRPFLSISRRYVITSERIRIIEGILGKSREDVELIRVQDVDQKQNLGERMLNLGDLLIRSHDTSNPSIELNNIRDPEQVHEILRRAVIKAREKYRLSYREEM